MGFTAKRVAMAVSLMAFIQSVFAAPAATPDKYVAGDHYILQDDAHGFLPTSTVAQAPTQQRCAGKGTKVMIVDRTDAGYTVRFAEVKAAQSADTCPVGALTVIEGSTYTITKVSANQLATKSTGLVFGTLVVPFKFRLGSDKKLVSSSTIAPYLGWRWSRMQGYGTDVIPVVSAGLGLVPVTNPVTQQTDTKSAFSLAAGFTLTNVKSANFSAGVLLGRDFLSKEDHQLDPTSKRMWVSIWVGLST